MDEKKCDIFLSRYYSYLCEIADGYENLGIRFYNHVILDDCFLYHVIDRIGIINNQKVFVKIYRSFDKLKMLWKKQIRKDTLYNKKMTDIKWVDGFDISYHLYENYDEYDWKEIRLMQEYILKEYYGVERK